MHVKQKKPFTYGGHVFRTLEDLRQHLSRVVAYDARLPDAPFYDEILADVVMDRHYIWSQQSERPTAFCFLSNAAGDGRGWATSLAGHFGERLGWQRFSYQKCCEAKEYTMEDEFIRLCRERWSSTWRPLFTRSTCEYPGCGDLAEDVDHVHPQHREIVEACWTLLSAQDREAWWRKAIDRSTGEHFALPYDHPVTRTYDEMSKHATYQNICKAHHRAETRARRRIIPA